MIKQKSEKQYELDMKGKEQSLRSHVRFSSKEYIQLQKDSLLVRKSIPTLLRESYFKGSPIQLLMIPEHSKKFLADFNRIGNNINQLARWANTGNIVSQQHLEEVRNQLKKIYLLISRFNGDCKNSI